jgi:hypothetical protein
MDKDQLRRFALAMPVIVGLVAGVIAIVEGPAWAVGGIAGVAIALLIPPIGRPILRMAPTRFAVLLATLITVAGVAIGLVVDHSASPAPITSSEPDLKATGYLHGKWYEQQGERPLEVFGTPGVRSTRTGPLIRPFQIVQVSCRVHVAGIKSAEPDGYWYRIASRPWNNRGYAAANAFWNDSAVREGPGVHNTDFRVPLCEAT